MRGRAEHAEAAGTADGGDDIAAMTERQQREFDAQHLADRRFHGVPPAAANHAMLADASARVRSEPSAFAARQLAYRRYDVAPALIPSRKIVLRKCLLRFNRAD